MHTHKQKYSIFRKAKLHVEGASLIVTFIEHVTTLAEPQLPLTVGGG